ncbi:MAG TPA: transketolase C-terminal domain-containing protein [Syntrophorhabdaceae bacterium]|nr:transketolase C-terminal domain-containing protein [Syntrophorhabdaceae bacterium]
MREAFFEVIEEIASVRDDIFILTGDLGYRLFDSFRKNCPDRFFDIGVAESNMVGIAAGLALSGKIVYCYSIVPFLVMRAFEQIRVDVAYHNANVRLVGVGGGLSYGMEGFTHLGVEDFVLMRSLQNMTVVAPADEMEARQIARISSEHEGPMYIRLGKNGDDPVHKATPEMRLGKALRLREGKDVAIFAIGNMVAVGCRVLDMLKAKGVDVELINMHTVKPLDTDAVLECASVHKAIFSLEEHIVNGGLGSAIAEVLSESDYKGFYKRIGVPERLNSAIGHSHYLRELYGLTPERIFDAMMKEMKGH